MDNKEIKSIVSEMLAKGLGLSEIQKRLFSENQVKITFLDLKLIASEIKDVAQTLDKNSSKKESEKPKPIEDNESDFVSQEGNTVDAELMDEGDTIVELDKLLRPGAALSGTVKFASGVKAGWTIDNYGRFALENASGKPTQDDLALFQAELRKKIGG
jgi:hypothetical protein